MSKKKYKKKINELTEKIKESKENLKQNKTRFKTKIEDLERIKQDFYSKFPKENLSSDKASEGLKQNEQLLKSIFSLYKSSIENKNKKTIIENRIDAIREENQIKYQQILMKVNELNQVSRERDDQIEKLQQEINKFISNEEIEFSQENYVINPGKEFTNNVAELVLAKEVHKRLKYLLDHSKKRTQRIQKELEDYEKSLVELKIEHNIVDPPPKSKEKKEYENQNEDAPVTDDKDNEDYNLDTIDDDLKCAVIDTEGLNQDILQELIDSPRFVDKVAETKKELPPLKLDLSMNKRNNYVNVLKIKYKEKPKENIENISKELETTCDTINDLKRELHLNQQKQKELRRKHNKLSENIKYSTNKIEILLDQIKMVRNQIAEIPNSDQIDSNCVSDVESEKNESQSSHSTRKKA